MTIDLTDYFEKFNFSIFGFGSMFSVLPLYGIYESKCKTVVNDENTKIKDCSGQIVEYQV